MVQKINLVVMSEGKQNILGGVRGKHLQTMNAGEGVEKTTFLHCWWKYKLIPPLWKTVWRFLKKLGLKPPYDPAIPLLGIYPKETIIEKKTHVSHCSLQHYLQ